MTYTPGGGTVADGSVTTAKLAGDVVSALDAKAPVSTTVTTADARLTDARTPTAHTHDDRYYTDAEIDALLAGLGGGPAFPVGSVFTAVVSTNPATLLGYGVWLAFGAGRMLVGLDALDPDFDTVEETGGAKTVTLTAAQSGLPAHRHQMLRERSATTGGATTLIARTSDTSSTADVNVFTENVAAANAAEAHPNLPPFIVVYLWKRTA